ncbi:retrovirus-related pol polyprotein from transposon TNT 1-94 [Tanacetum coccineum]
METIHVTFDELTLMASKQFSSGPGLQFMNPATSSSRLIPNPIPQQAFNPPTRNDWDCLFQPMFDEYFNPPLSTNYPIQVDATPRVVDIADSPVSTSIDQDAPSTSIPSTQEQYPIISQESSIVNVIGDPSRSVSTIKQLQTDAIWCYFDAFLTLVELKTYKDAILKPSWINAMQEEIHEFKRLQVWYNPPTRNDWDRLFQPMFDEYFNPPPSFVSLIQVAATPRVVDIADSHVSTLIDQDAPSTSIPSTQEQEQSLIISQGVEESPKTPYFHDDPLHETLHEDSTSQGSSSNVRPSHSPFELLGKWTKNHPIANVIEDPSRSVSTRKKLHTNSIWCYFDAFLTSVKPKNYKEAMLEPSWIDAMQEEIHEFERVQVWELVDKIEVDLQSQE